MEQKPLSEVIDNLRKTIDSQKDVVSGDLSLVEIDKKIASLEGGIIQESSENSADLRDTFNRLIEILENGNEQEQTSAREQIDALSKSVESEEERREKARALKEQTNALYKVASGLDNFEKSLNDFIGNAGKAAFGLGALALLFKPELVLDFILGALDFLQDGFNAIGRLLEGDVGGILDLIKEHTVAFGVTLGILAVKFGLLSGVASIIRGGIKAWGIAVKLLNSNLMKSAGKLIANVGKGILNVGVKLWKGALVLLNSTLVKNAAQLIATVAKKGLTSAIGLLGRAFTAIRVFMMGSLIPALTGMLSTMAAAIAPILVAAAPFIAIGAAIAAAIYGIYESFGKAFEIFEESGSIMKALAGFFIHLVTSPIRWVKSLVSTIAGWLGFDGFSEWLDSIDITDMLMDGFGAVFDWIGDKLSYLNPLNWFSGDTIESARETISSIFDWIGDKLKYLNPLNWFGGDDDEVEATVDTETPGKSFSIIPDVNLSSITDSVTDAASSAVDWFSDNLNKDSLMQGLSSVKSSIGDTLSSAASSTFNWVNETLGLNLSQEELISSVSTTFTSVKDTLTSSATKAFDWVSDKLNLDTTNISTTFTSLSETVSSTATEAFNWVSDKLNLDTTSISTTFTSLTETVSSAATTAFNWVSDKLNLDTTNISTTFTSLADTVSSTATEAFNWVSNKLNLDTTSISSTFTSLADTVSSTATEAFNWVSNKLNLDTTSISSTFTSLTDTVSSAASSAINWVSDKLNIDTTNISTTFSSLTDTLSTSASSAFSWITDKLNVDTTLLPKDGDDLLNKISSVWDTVKNWLMDLLPSIDDLKGIASNLNPMNWFGGSEEEAQAISQEQLQELRTVANMTEQEMQAKAREIDDDSWTTSYDEAMEELRANQEQARQILAENDAAQSQVIESVEANNALIQSSAEVVSESSSAQQEITERNKNAISGVNSISVSELIARSVVIDQETITTLLADTSEMTVRNNSLQPLESSSSINSEVNSEANSEVNSLEAITSPVIRPEVVNPIRDTQQENVQLVAEREAANQEVMLLNQSSSNRSTTSNVSSSAIYVTNDTSADRLIRDFSYSPVG
jgi:hypothetical protein